MEDYKPDASEVDEAPVKGGRHVRGNFLKTWLDKDSKEEKSKKSKKAESKDGQEEKSVVERIGEKFKGVLSRLISLEKFDVKPAGAAEIDDKNDLERQTSDLELAGEATTLSPETPAASNQEEGILAVSPDAQRRYYGHELPETPASDESINEADWPNEPATPDEERQAKDLAEARAAAEREHQAATAETTQPLPEQKIPSDNEEISSVSAQTETAQSSGSAEPVGETLRRQQTERLERRVKRLKRQTRTIKREQQDIVEQQKKFAKQIDANQEAQKRFEKVTVPKMEKAREELHKRLETASEQAKKPVPAPEKPAVIARQEKPEVRAVIPEAPNQKVEIKTEYRPELKIVEAKPDKPQPEIINRPERYIPVPEDMPSKIVSEQQYERRHEVKDTPGTLQNGWPTSAGTSGYTPPTIPPPIVTQPAPSVPPAQPSRPVPTPPTPQAKTKQPEMYKQAAQNGFLAGLAIAIALILTLMLTR